MACMYIPVCIMCYFTYGDSIRDSTINSLQIVWIQQVSSQACKKGNKLFSGSQCFHYYSLPSYVNNCFQPNHAGS